MTYTVIYDANVLYSAPQRDFLIRIAQTGVVRARWSEKILDEAFRSILRDRPDLDEGKLSRTRELMNAAIRDVLVTGYEPLIEGLDLPDADDRHVLAAAIKGGAQTIVTWNLKDFPDHALKPYGIQAQDPDDFVMCQLDIDEALVLKALEAQTAALRNPVRTVVEVIALLDANRLSGSADRLRNLTEPRG